jgi:excinuclease ABC subunit A
MANLILKGVRQNNLKDVDVDLPLGRRVVLTGPSGSGKSSLAFETIYAEGQRRYMQSLSTYARQFLEKFRAPDADQIQNIPPTIALEQLNPVRNSRATVGTSTEIYDYLRLLFEKIGIEYCPNCNIPMERLGLLEMFRRTAEAHAGEVIIVGSQKIMPKVSADAVEFLKDYLRLGYSRFVAAAEIHNVQDYLEKPKFLGKPLYWIVDRLKLPDLAEAETVQTRITESIRNAMNLGGGEVHMLVDRNKRYEESLDFTSQSRCPKCRKTAAPKSSISFSFNSPLGACEKCKGFGNTLEVDETLVIPNSQLSIAQGAIDPFTKPSLSHWQKKTMAYCKENRIDAELPFKELSEKQRKAIYDGDKKFKGVRGVFEMLEKEKYKMRVRVFISRYTSAFTCSVCHGNRLADSALRVKVGDLNIAEICGLTVEQGIHFFKELLLEKREREIARDIFSQLDRRLDTLNTVGLGYLTLARLTRSLSGGEYQRILLATQLSQGLTDTMYVLDEPSIGLHPKDTKQLLKVLNRLHDLGNSLVLVEHDPEVIEWGDYIVDMGPGSGSRGGNVVFAGSKDLFMLSDCQTSIAIRNWKQECVRLESKKNIHDCEWIDLKGAQENNLKNIDVSIPLGCLVAITGVSGSGKSTLIVDTFYQALCKIFTGRSETIGKFESLTGFENLSSVELVDQSAIGKSSRSNPMTFMKGYDEVRSLFAHTREAVAKKLTPGHFSFNVKGGRCDACEGEGRVKVDMVFMEDIWVPCQTCDQKRFKPLILGIKYRAKNIDDVLKLTIDEAYEFFSDIASLKTKLALLKEVGLGYLQLGQPGFSLSGGEAQRLKVARELAGTSVKRGRTLFVLDEPTTGLHFGEITRLISVLRRLVAAGHTVVVIEHNLQLICAADYVIDLGPDGGSGGGAVVAVGTPRELAQKKLPHTGLYLSEILK